jgi:outer membrane lipoprotein-sorting protein
MDCDETLRESKMTNEKSKWVVVRLDSASSPQVCSPQVIKVLCLLLVAAGVWRAGGCTGNSAKAEPKAGTNADSVVRQGSPQVDSILEQLKEKTAELKSYQSGIEYRFSQPILESETLRKGVLYYQRTGEEPSFAKATEGRSALRINFQTLKQDDGQEEEYIEQYIFDGVWLTHIDYQIRQVRRYQQAEPNKPAEVFDLVRENFPIIGFSRTEDLRKEFEISLVEQQDGDFVQLHLKVKPDSTSSPQADSIYKDDYTAIDFWIDKKLYLPAKIVAASTEGDIYEIRLLGARVNEKIDANVFEVKIPEGFGVETEPLKRNPK